MLMSAVGCTRRGGGSIARDMAARASERRRHSWRLLSEDFHPGGAEFSFVVVPHPGCCCAEGVGAAESALSRARRTRTAHDGPARTARRAGVGTLGLDEERTGVADLFFRGRIARRTPREIAPSIRPRPRALRGLAERRLGSRPPRASSRLRVVPRGRARALRRSTWTVNGPLRGMTPRPSPTCRCASAWSASKTSSSARASSWSGSRPAGLACTPRSP